MRRPLSRLPPCRRPHTICSICRTKILRTTCMRCISSSLRKLLKLTMALVPLQSSPNIPKISNLSSSSSNLSTRRCPRNQFITSQPPSHLPTSLICSMLSSFPMGLLLRAVCLLLAYSSSRLGCKHLLSWVGSNERWLWGAQIDSDVWQMSLLGKIVKRLQCLFRQSTCPIFASSKMTKTIIPRHQKLRNRTRPT